MKKDPKVFIHHILESIELIEKYSKNMTQIQFLKKSSTQDAIVRRLSILSIDQVLKLFGYSHESHSSKWL